MILYIKGYYIETGVKKFGLSIILQSFIIQSFRFSPVHGLIFLFKWRSGEEVDGSIVRDSRLEEIFFAKQVGTAMYNL